LKLCFLITNITSQTVILVAKYARPSMMVGFIKNIKKLIAKLIVRDDSQVKTKQQSTTTNKPKSKPGTQTKKIFKQTLKALISAITQILIIACVFLVCEFISSPFFNKLKKGSWS